MKKKTKNKLDEMQEQKMLKIEHNSCWLAFWGLFAALMVQILVYGTIEWRYVAGEWLVFMCLAAYLCAACIKNGIWDRRLSPTPGVNAGISLLGGIVVGILNYSLIFKISNGGQGCGFGNLFGTALLYLVFCGSYDLHGCL